MRCISRSSSSNGTGSAKWLGRSAGNESVDRAREPLRHARERPSDQEPGRTFADRLFLYGIQGLQLLRSAARREKGTPIRNRGSGRTKYGRGRKGRAGAAT